MLTHTIAIALDENPAKKTAHTKKNVNPAARLLEMLFPRITLFLSSCEMVRNSKDPEPTLVSRAPGNNTRNDSAKQELFLSSKKPSSLSTEKRTGKENRTFPQEAFPWPYEFA
jgi:hypothetical protein